MANTHIKRYLTLFIIKKVQGKPPVSKYFVLLIKLGKITVGKNVGKWAVITSGESIHWYNLSYACW